MGCAGGEYAFYPVPSDAMLMKAIWIHIVETTKTQQRCYCGYRRWGSGDTPLGARGRGTGNPSHQSVQQEGPGEETGV